MNKYGFNVAWSEEDGGYIASCPEFPGLSAFGLSVETALAEAQAAMRLLLKTYEEDGVPLPKPQTVQQYSGQTRLRLSKSVHRLAVELAASEGVSLNQFILDAINERIGAEKSGSHFVGELKKALAENAQQRRLDIASIVWQEDRGTQFSQVIRSVTESGATARTDLTKGN